MNRSTFLKSLFIILDILLIFACEKFEYNNNNILLPVSDGDSYIFSEIKIDSLTDISPLKSSRFEILDNSKIIAEENVGDKISAESDSGISDGENININYNVENNVIVPKDYKSMAALSILYLFDQAVEFYENNIALDLSDLGTIKIHYAPVISFSDSSISGEFTAFGNAAFVFSDNSFMVFKSGKGEEIPLAINQGVITHEFTHYIISKYVSEEEDYTKFMNFNALHEGLSDFFAVLHTGETNYITPSLPDESEKRGLPVDWIYEEVEMKANELGASDFPAYVIGSVIASALFEAQQTINSTGYEIGQLIIGSLSLLGKSLAANDSYDYPLYTYFEILAGSSGTNLNALCTSFKKWFASIYADISSCEGI